MFLKSFSRPYLGITPPTTSKQISASAESGTLSCAATDEANAKVNGAFPALAKDEDELVEKEIRDRFKRMCEGYFESVAKKLVNEHTVRLVVLCAPSADLNILDSVCKSKTNGTTKPTSAQERYSRTGNRRTRR